MNKYLFFFSRLIAVIASIVISISLFSRGLGFRVIPSTILLLMFLITSFLFEEKRKKITVSYIFVFFNLFITNTLVASFYSLDTIPNLYHDDKLSSMIGVFALHEEKSVANADVRNVARGSEKFFIRRACTYVRVRNFR